MEPVNGPGSAARNRSLARDPHWAVGTGVFTHCADQRTAAWRSRAVNYRPETYSIEPDAVTTAELLSDQLQGARPREVGTRILTIGGVRVARVTTDVGRLNPITATSSTDLPALEMLGALAGHDPTGVMLIEHPGDSADFAFNLVRGRITGARGEGPLHDLPEWSKVLYERFPDRASTTPPPPGKVPSQQWLQLAREFVREHALQSLQDATAPGTRITLLRGDVGWLGPSIPVESGSGLQHLLLEQARRRDELPRMLTKLGSLQQLVLPMYEPGELPPGGKPLPSGGVSEGWGGSEPDGPNRSTWALARQVYRYIDGQRSLAELIDFGMFGTFRTLQALTLLAKNQSIILATSPAPTRARSKVLELTPQPPQRRPEPPAPDPLVPAPPAEARTPRPQLVVDPARPSTGYMLKRRARGRVEPKPRPSRRPTPPPRPAPKPPTPFADPYVDPDQETARIPRRTAVAPHPDIITPEPPSVRKAEVGGGRTLLDALEAEIATLNSEEGPRVDTSKQPHRLPWNFILLSIIGSLLFAAGAAFSLMLG